MQISNESSRCTTDIEKVHRICADAWKFGAFAFVCVPVFRSSDNFAYGAPPNTAGSKCERPVETVVQLGPLTGVDQFVDGFEIKIRRSSGQQRTNVLRRGFHQFP